MSVRDDVDQAFGAHLRALRKARGLTQEQLARASKLSADTVRRLERGGCSATLGTLARLCAGLGLSLTTMMAGLELVDVEQLELADALRGLDPGRRGLAIELLRVVAQH